MNIIKKIYRRIAGEILLFVLKKREKSFWGIDRHFFFRKNKISSGGIGNRVEISGQNSHLTIRINGNNNRVVLDGTNISGLTIGVTGDNCSVTIKSSRNIMNSDILVLDNESAVEIGQNTGLNGGTIITAGGKAVTIGKNVMIADKCELWASDTHSILDIESGERINKDASITIGNDVWLGIGVRVCKGVVINDGAVIGMGSIVTKDVPNNTIAAGVPAKVVKRNIKWDVRRL